MRTTGVSGRLLQGRRGHGPDVRSPGAGAGSSAAAAPAPQAPRAAAQPGQPPRPAVAAARCRRPRTPARTSRRSRRSLARTPQEQAKAFILPPGYRMELVVADPDVISPAVIGFDGNGRMYVAEFISYMRDADGNSAARARRAASRATRAPRATASTTSTPSSSTSSSSRARSCRSTATASSPTRPHSDDVVKYTDTNDDGVADKRELFYTGIGIGRDGNLEHEQAGFIWGLDNWIYSTYNAFRIRWTPNGILAEPTGPNGGQWGVTLDDDGKMWFMDAGGERGPVNFQVPIHYGAFTVRRCSSSRASRSSGPAPGVADMQGGMLRVRMPVGALNHFTAASGADIVRAHRLPAGPARRPARYRAGRPPDPARADRQDRRADAAAQRVSRIGVRPRAPIRCSGRSTSRTAPDGDALHRRHVPRHHPGSAVDAARLVPAARRSSSTSSTRSSGTAASGGCASTACPACRRPRRARPAQATPEIPAQPALALDPTRPRMLDETPAQLVRAPRAIRTAGGATRRSSCSCCSRTSRSCPRSRSSSARRTTCWRASTRCGRSKGWARSTPRSCASR